jgi:hypothetical protein
MLCVNDHFLFKGQGFLCLFLPTNIEKIEWVDELIKVWKWLSLYPSYDMGFFSLFSDLFMNCNSKFDVENYLPFFFTQILRCLDLPIGNSPSSMFFFFFFNNKIGIIFL